VRFPVGRRFEDVAQFIKLFITRLRSVTLKIVIIIILNMKAVPLPYSLTRNGVMNVIRVTRSGLGGQNR
jgi:hypothetical protein